MFSKKRLRPGLLIVTALTALGLSSWCGYTMISVVSGIGNLTDQIFMSVIGFLLLLVFYACAYGFYASFRAAMCAQKSAAQPC